MIEIIIISGIIIFIAWFIYQLQYYYKSKLFQEQLRQAGEKAIEIKDRIAKPFLNYTAELKKKNDLKFMELRLKHKLKLEADKTEIDKQAIVMLVETGMKRKEAEEFLKEK